MHNIYVTVNVCHISNYKNPKSIELKTALYIKKKVPMFSSFKLV